MASAPLAVFDDTAPSLESDWDTFCAIESEIGAAESTGLEARWRCGQMLLRYEKRQGSKNSPLAAAVRKLSAELGVSERELLNRRQFAEEYPNFCDVPQKFWEAIVHEELGKRGTHIANNSGDNEWYTPREYILAAAGVMGGIDLDPASSPEANEVVQAAKFHTADDDGLQHDWIGRVWMNPPYARPLIDNFCGKLADEYAEGRVTEACVLVNNATETGWFHGLAEVASALCFPRHRVKFWHPRKEATPLQGQAVVYLGPSPEHFQTEFVRFGFCARLL